MGKGGGGKQTVQQNAEPWSGARPYLGVGLEDLRHLYHWGTGAAAGSNISTPAYYPGSTVAPMSQWTSTALELQRQRGLAGSPVTDAAQAATTAQAWGEDVLRANPNAFGASGQQADVLGGGMLNSNPYLSSAINYATAPVEAAVNSAFSSAGRYGSGAHADQLARNIGDIASNMAFQGYGMERGFQEQAAARAYDELDRARQRQFQASALAPTLANQDYFDINQLGTVGSAMDAYAQALTNADVERFNYGQDADWRRVQDFLATVQGSAPTGSTSVSRTTPNAFSSALGTGLGLAGLGNMLGLFGGAGLGGAGLGGAAGSSALLGAAAAFSDERLKYDIDRVGELDSGLPIYTYHYLWEGDDAPKHFGVMAQEALELKPEAVGMLGGYLTVNPDKVTEPA